MQSAFAKRQFEFVVFVSYSFSIFCTVIYSQCYKINFLYFTNLLNAEALLPLAEPDCLKIGHMTRAISLN